MTKLLLPRGYRNAELLSKRLISEPENKWIYRGKKRALDQFHAMSQRVPAYKDFLQKNNFSANQVKTVNDLQKIPPIDKDNYLRKYSKDMLCWDGVFPHGQWVISTTSGTTGKPYYFPREQSQDWQYALMAELYLRANFDIDKKSTLYIVAFPMGAWIGGVFTYEALKIVASHGGYDLSIITPGIHKQEVINAVLQLGENYDQIIIGAYAPFLKDILDDGERAGIKWNDYDLGFVFSAEAFTEKFRDFVEQKAKPKNEYKFSLNHYGTVDLGTMSYETPESIFVRRALVDNNKLSLLFPEERRQPTLTQFIPELFYFDQMNNNLFCTAYSGIPLVRYDLKDYGGVITKEEVNRRLHDEIPDYDKKLHNAGIADSLWNLPFVYVYERNDLSVSYYAFLVYPDMIRRALQHDELAKFITGKFTMIVDYSKEGRQHLKINCELKHSVSSNPQLESNIQEIIHRTLIEESSEYRETAGMVGEKVKPIVHLWPYEDATYFRAGTKQKWVLK